MMPIWLVVSMQSLLWVSLPLSSTRDYKAGKLPVTLQSTDNCSHNGDHVKAGVKAYAERWVKDGIVEADFLDYINDDSRR